MKKKDALLKKLGQSLEQPAASPPPARKTAAAAKPRVSKEKSADSDAPPAATSSSPPPTAAKPRPTPATTTPSLRDQADVLVARAVPWSMGVGLIPIPLVDCAAVMALQLKLLRQLSELYKKPFAETQAKAVIASLIGGILPTAIAGGSAATFLKFFPGAGSLLGAATVSAASGASTLAIGKVFIAHFETGGSLLDVNPAQLQDSFAFRYAEARQHVTQFATALKP